MTAKFRKKPVVIEAVQIRPSTFDGPHPNPEHVRGVRYDPIRRCAMIETLEGTMRADMWDWIIKGVKGELYPCKPDIFEATYEAVQPCAAAQSGRGSSMTREEFYLQCLAEECCEVAQAISKCLIFGTMTKIPAAKGGDGERNHRDHLNDEIHDVTVLVERLQRMGTIATWVSPTAHEMRQQKLGQKLYDAECLGMVDA